MAQRPGLCVCRERQRQRPCRPLLRLAGRFAQTGGPARTPLAREPLAVERARERHMHESVGCEQSCVERAVSTDRAACLSTSEEEGVQDVTQDTRALTACIERLAASSGGRTPISCQSVYLALQVRRRSINALSFCALRCAVISSWVGRVQLGALAPSRWRHRPASPPGRAACVGLARAHAARASSVPRALSAHRRGHEARCGRGGGGVRRRAACLGALPISC